MAAPGAAGARILPSLPSWAWAVLSPEQELNQGLEHYLWARILCGTSSAFPLPAVMSSQGLQLRRWSGIPPLQHTAARCLFRQPRLAINLEQGFEAEIALLKSSLNDGRKSQVCSGIFSQALDQHPAPPTVLRDYKAEAARKSVSRWSFMSHALLGLGSRSHDKNSIASLKFVEEDKQELEVRREPGHQPWSCSSLVQPLWDEFSSLLLT